MKPTRNESGQFDAYAWPGGYPIFYLLEDNAVLCPDCANRKNGSIALLKGELDADGDPVEKRWAIVAADINHEDGSLYCDHCGKQIESAYGENDNASNE